jgi:hypothetical protein
MKNYIIFFALIVVSANIIGSQDSEKKKVGFTDHLVVRVYNENMPITRDIIIKRASSQKFDLFHSVSFTKSELLQGAPLYKKFLGFMGCLPHLRSQK